MIRPKKKATGLPFRGNFFEKRRTEESSFLKPVTGLAANKQVKCKIFAWHFCLELLFNLNNNDNV